MCYDMLCIKTKYIPILWKKKSIYNVIFTQFFNFFFIKQASANKKNSSFSSIVPTHGLNFQIVAAFTGCINNPKYGLLACSGDHQNIPTVLTVLLMATNLRPQSPFSGRWKPSCRGREKANSRWATWVKPHKVIKKSIKTLPQPTKKSYKNFKITDDLNR